MESCKNTVFWCKRSLNSNFRVRWFFGDTSLPSSRSAGLPNKVVMPPANILFINFLASYVASSTSLGSGTKARRRGNTPMEVETGEDRGSLLVALTVFGGNCQLWGSLGACGAWGQECLVFPHASYSLNFESCDISPFHKLNQNFQRKRPGCPHWEAGWSC